MKYKVIRYGDHADQFCRLYRPTDAYTSEADVPHLRGALPVAVLIHGGYWSKHYTIDNALIDTLPPFFLSHGFAVYNMEYRRVGSGSGGGWPRTNNDILEGLRKLPEQPGLDLDRVLILGHSAGGCLALWSCCRLQERDLGFAPRLCVAVAPVADLEQGQRRGLSSDGTAIAKYMGHFPCAFVTQEVATGSCCGLYVNDMVNKNGPPVECHEICQYKIASPSAILPVETALLIVQGDDDEIVPKDYVDEFHDKVMSGTARPIFPVEYLVIRDADHFQVVNAKEKAWGRVFAKIQKYM